MALINIGSASAARPIRAWLRKSVAPAVGMALSADRATAVFATVNASFSVRLADGESVAAVLAAVEDSGRLVWTTDGSGTALAFARRAGVNVDRLAFISCLQTLRYVLEPGTEPVAPKRVPAAHSAALFAAEEAARLNGAHGRSERLVALQSVAHDKSWRPRMQVGTSVDGAFIAAEGGRMEAERVRFLDLLGTDLTQDTEPSHQWLFRRGIRLTDANGQPSLSRDFYDTVLVPDGMESDWAVFLKVRTVGRWLQKLRELNRFSIDGRVFSRYTTHGTTTGRSTSTKPALQNISGDLRRVLTASPGNALVSLDLSACEPTVAAALSGDTQMIADLAAGDIYTMLAQQQYGTDALASHPGCRTLFKVLLIADLYGRSAGSAALSLSISLAEAEAIRARMRARWPVLHAWIAANRAAAERGEALPTADGRQVSVPKGKAYAATCYLVQSTAATLIFQRGVDRVVARLGSHTLLLGVHDELVLEVKDNDRVIADALSVLEECMPTVLNGVHITGTAQHLGTMWAK